MSFSNLSVAIENLPTTQLVNFQPIQPSYLKVLRITWSIIFGVLFVALIALFVFVQELQSVQWIFILSFSYLVLAISTVTIGTASFKQKAFAIREKDILYKTGWIFSSMHIIPFNRIQHCVLNIGPIERKYGLASIGIYTAASDVYDVFIRGLSKEQAEQLRDFILQQIQKEASND